MSTIEQARKMGEKAAETRDAEDARYFRRWKEYQADPDGCQRAYDDAYRTRSRELNPPMPFR